MGNKKWVRSLKKSNKSEELLRLAKNMRRIILEVSLNCGEPAHIGGGLSIVDIMAVLYGNILKLESIAERFAGSRFTENVDKIRKWKNKDAKLISKLVNSHIY